MTIALKDDFYKFVGVLPYILNIREEKWGLWKKNDQQGKIYKRDDDTVSTVYSKDCHSLIEDYFTLFRVLNWILFSQFYVIIIQMIHLDETK